MSDDDRGGYLARDYQRERIATPEPARTIGDASATPYERPSPEAQALTGKLRGAIGVVIAGLDRLRATALADGHSIEEQLGAAVEEAERILTALGNEKVPNGCLAAVQIRDARTTLEEASREIASRGISASHRVGDSTGTDADRRLDPGVAFAPIAGRDAAYVRRDWITGSSHKAADRIRTDRLLEVLVALRASGRFAWATDADLDAAACAQTRLPADAVDAIVTLELGVLMSRHAGLPAGEPARIEHRGDGLEIVFAFPGAARDGEWVAINAEAAMALIGALQTHGYTADAARVESADLRALVRHGAAHLVLTTAQCAELLGQAAIDTSAYARSWLTTNLGAASDTCHADTDLAAVIQKIDRHPYRAAIIRHARATSAGRVITGPLLETLAHDAVEAELASRAAKPTGADWSADAAAMAASLGLGSVEIRTDATARAVADAANANGVALGGVVHLHPERVQPGTSGGREVLAHELIHLAQARLGAEDDRDEAEDEAADLAPLLASGASVRPQLAIDLGSPAADKHAKRHRKPKQARATTAAGPDAIAQAETKLTEAEQAAQAIQTRLDQARDQHEPSSVVDELVDSLGRDLVIIEGLALSDPTLPEQRKDRLPAVFERLDRLKAEVARFQVDHHGYSQVAHLTGEADPKPTHDSQAAITPGQIATVAEMQDALVAAMAAASVSDLDRAMELYEPVLQRFTELRYCEASLLIMQWLGAARTHFELELDEANTGLIELYQAFHVPRAARLMPLAYKKFKIATEILRVLNREIAPEESKLVRKVENATSHRMQVVLGPVLMFAAAYAAPEVITWAMANPNTALAVVQSSVALAPAIIEAGGPYEWLKGVIDDPARAADVASALANAYADYQMGRAADGELTGDLETSPPVRSASSADDGVHEASVSSGSTAASSAPVADETPVGAKAPTNASHNETLEQATRSASNVQRVPQQGDPDTEYQYDQMRPGPLSNRATYDPKNEGNTLPAQGFYGGKYDELRLPEDTILYRVGNAQREWGEWFTDQPLQSEAQYRIDVAVKREWSDPATGTMKTGSVRSAKELELWCYSLLIPKGTTVYRGPVGTQGDVFMGGLSQTQYFIPKAWTLTDVGGKVVAKAPFVRDGHVQPEPQDQGNE